MNKEIYVYCTDCTKFRCDEELPYCKDENKCDINDCEDSKPFTDRPYYKPNICNKCNEQNADGKCLRIGVNGDRGICWMEKSEGEY